MFTRSRWRDIEEVEIMTRYELVVIWDDGEKEVFGYQTKAEAKDAAVRYRMEYGTQVFTCVRRVIYGC